MTEETTTPAADQNVQISFEQITAAILVTLGEVTVPVANIIAYYSGKTIAVNQNPDNKDLIFAIVDIPAPAEAAPVEEDTTETE